MAGKKIESSTIIVAKQRHFCAPIVPEIEYFSHGFSMFFLIISHGFSI